MMIYSTLCRAIPLPPPPLTYFSHYVFQVHSHKPFILTPMSKGTVLIREGGGSGRYRRYVTQRLIQQGRKTTVHSHTVRCIVVFTQ